MRYLLSLIFLFASLYTWAQPGNNDCSGLIDLGVAPFCDNQVFTNVDATPFDIDFENEPNCFVENPPQNDVWFSFTANSVDEDYVVTITGNPDGGSSISNIQAAVYRGSCDVNSLAVFECAAGDANETVLSFQLSGLTTNDDYYIRVDNFGGDGNEGGFNLCVEVDANVNDISQGSSDACAGILYDTGGPDGNYSDDENHIFTICPSEFHQCVTFNLEYYNIQSVIESFEIGDYLTFYDGPTINSPEILELGTNFYENFDSGGGGVCLSVQASDCLTIQFTSDDGINFEGFKGAWECSVEPCAPLDQIGIGEQPSDEQVENVLSVVPGSVTLDNINCPPGSYALFDNGNQTDLGINEGILLTSGNATNSLGPNLFGDTSTEHYAPGDSDLDILSTIFGQGNPSMDACVVEVDVVAFSSTLSFEYIFVSEEYPEFVNTEWNDIFALLISGPGIIGEALLNNQQNMAIIPGTNTPVEINSINNFTNWEYYRNNQIGQSLEYDGFTTDRFGVKKSLTAIANVEPCNTYHLKFAIADRTDAAWDSGVFISEINTGVPTMTLSFSNGQDYLTESCATANNFIEIMLSEALADTLFLNGGANTFEVSGTAVEGTDYTFDIPDTLFFAPGETLIRIPLFVVSDGVEEPNETIIFTINNSQCGDVQVAMVETFIADNVEVIINDGADSISVCRGEELILTGSGGNTHIWEPAAFVSNPTEASTSVETDESRWYYLTESLEGNQDPSCVSTDSVFVRVIGANVEINTLDTTSFCMGDSIRVFLSTTADPSNISWSNTDGVVDTMALATTIIPTVGSQTGVDYIVTVSDEQCTHSDTLTLFVTPFDFPSYFHSDTTICQGESVQLAELIEGSTTLYQWTPTEALDDDNSSGAIATPDETTTFQLIAQSPNGECRDTAEVTIDVIPNFVDIVPDGDTLLLCLEDSIFLNTLSSSNGENLAWTPTDVLSDSVGPSVWAKPGITTTIYVELTGDICSDIDSVVIRVDSLPELAVEAIPFREKYCMGEIVTLFSPGYDEDLYPHIVHSWSPPLGVQTDLDDLNLAFAAVDTTYYIRSTVNGACSSEDSILINVVVPNLMLSLSDTIICPGEPVSVELTAPQELENISWSPSEPNVISCSDCANPTMTVSQSTTFSVSADADGCPSGASMTINIAGGFNIGFDVVPGLEVGLGSDAIVTAIINPDPGPNTIYTWTVNGSTLTETGISVTVPILEEVNEITVEFEDEFGCKHSATIFINGVPPKFVFPNAFTPGSSPDLNDNFFPWFSTLQQWEINNFFIYNRWGQKVFDCQDKECFEVGWDGMYKEKEAPSGVYMFVFNFTLPNGETKTQKGDITLIR